MKHLTHRQFKNIFGDWGITAWVKFNWLSNGLPDGVYNGLTKITIKSVTSINNNKRAFVSTVKPIAVTNSDVWQYGLSNYEKTDSNTQLDGLGRPNIAVDINGWLWVSVPNIPQTVQGYNDYLAKHPLIFCYYDRTEWTGLKIEAVTRSEGTGLYYASVGIKEKEIRELKGNFEKIEPTSAQNMALDPRDMIIMNGTSTANRIYMKDVSIQAVGSAEIFKAKHLPLYVVYK